MNLGFPSLRDPYGRISNSRNLRLLCCLGAFVFAAHASAAILTIAAVDASIKTVGGKIEGARGEEGGWNLWSEGDLGEYVKFPSDGTYKLVVRARGSVAKGIWPLMAVTLDSRQLAVITVDAKQFTDYPFDVKTSAGTHRLVVSYLNDAVTPDPRHPTTPPWLEDRNLYVNCLTILPPTGGEGPTIGSAADAAKAALAAENDIVAQTAAAIDRNRKSRRRHPHRGLRRQGCRWRERPRGACATRVSLRLQHLHAGPIRHR